MALQIFGGGASAAALSNTFVARGTTPRGLRAKFEAADTAPVDVVYIGTSLTEGQNVTDEAHRWTARLRDRLRAQYPSGAVGGEGYVPAYYVVSNLTDRFTGVVTPNGLSYGLGRRHMTLSVDGNESVTFTGTGVDILWAKTTVANARFTWAIDGGTTTSVQTGGFGATSNDGITQIRGLSAGSHTLALARVSTDTPAIGGIMVYNGDESKGVRTWNAGHSSYTSADMTVGVGGSLVPQWAALANVTADVVFIEVGANDVKPTSSITPAQMIANVTSLVAQVNTANGSTPTYVIVGTWARITTGVTEAMWPPYFQALRDYATANGHLFLDLMTPFGTNAQAFAAGLIDADLTHLTNAGSGLVASEALSLLARAYN